MGGRNEGRKGARKVGSKKGREEGEGEIHVHVQYTLSYMYMSPPP